MYNIGNLGFMKDHSFLLLFLLRLTLLFLYLRFYFSLHFHLLLHSDLRPCLGFHFNFILFDFDFNWRR